MSQPRDGLDPLTKGAVLGGRAGVGCKNQLHPGLGFWDALRPSVSQAQQGLDLQIRVLAQALPFPNDSLSSSRVFFRRHYPLAAIRFCGMDPENRK